MRTQDELLRAFKVSPPPAQRYIVRQLERLPLAFDADEVVEFLDRERAGAPAGLKEQLLLCLGTLVPRFHRFRLQAGREEAKGRASLWTLHQIKVEDLAKELDSASEKADASLHDPSLEGLHRAAFHQLAGCFEALYGAPSSENQLTREEAIYLLGRCPTPRGLAALARIAEKPETASLAALSLARLERKEADAPLHQTVRRAAESGNGPALLALRDRPGDDALATLARAAANPTAEVRRCAAIALEKQPAEAALPILEKLVIDTDEWTAVHALDSLGRTRSPRAIVIVANAFARSQHPFIRMVALRAAASLPCEQAVQLCVKAIAESKVDIVRAMAIEALVRLGAPKERFREFAGLLAGQDSIKLASNLVLAMAGTEKDAVNKALKGMLASPNELSRAEAAFCLGYLDDPAALKLLYKLIDRDVSDIVRGQALLGLFRQRPRKEARQLLFELMGHPTAEVRRQVARMLRTPELVSDQLTRDHLSERLEEEQDPIVRVELLQSLTVCAEDQAKAGLSAAFDSSDTSALAAASDVAARTGDRALAPRLLELAGNGDARVRSRAARALWLLGDSAGAPALRELLQEPYFESFRLGGKALEEMLCELACLDRRDVKKPLFQHLRDQMKTQSYAAYVKSDGSGILAPESLVSESAEDFDYAPMRGQSLFKEPGREGEAMLRQLDRMFESGEAKMPSLTSRTSEFRDFTLMQTDGMDDPSLGGPGDSDKVNIRALYKQAVLGDFVAESRLRDLTRHAETKVREAAIKLLNRVQDERGVSGGAPGGGTSAAPSLPEEPYPVPLEDLLREAVRVEASDIHISAGYRPIFRVHGSMEKTRHPQITEAHSRYLVRQLVTRDRLAGYEAEKDFDFSFTLPGVGSFRGNAFHELHGPGLVLRVVPSKIPSFEELGSPPLLRNVCREEKGLVLVTGPTGSGKSTTMAAMLSYINQNRSCHIVTIEDPIEFVHSPLNSKFIQREVPAHALSFSRALRAALREDPDVIMVGELRDLETMELAIAAAETGHLVLSTLHTINAPLTVDRVINVFPGEQQEQIRRSVSECLLAVVSQTLLPRKDKPGRVAAFECMSKNPAVSNLIRKNELHQIPNVMLGCKKEGMMLLDDCLYDLVTKGVVSLEAALLRAVMKKEFAEKYASSRRAARG